MKEAEEVAKGLLREVARVGMESEEVAKGLLGEVARIEMNSKKAMEGKTRLRFGLREKRYRKRG